MPSWSKPTTALTALALAATTALAHPMQLGSRALSSPDQEYTLCGTSDYAILSGTPWIVDNMVYNAAEMVGTQCTNYEKIENNATTGNDNIVWSSVTDVEYVESTDNVPKGYSFIGLTANLESTISSIQEIPASYSWTRTNTTAFKGNVCFDFMTSDTKGDSTSSSAQELMLWLQYEGGQLPIGWGDSTQRVEDLFGTSWTAYAAKNDDTGITVTSLLPDTQFDGYFEGDLKDWFAALVKLGLFTDSTYVNVGNAGTEYFYGNAVMNATLGLQINL